MAANARSWERGQIPTLNLLPQTLKLHTIIASNSGAKDRREFEEVSDGRRHWVRVNVRNSDGGLLVL